MGPRTALDGFSRILKRAGQPEKRNVYASQVRISVGPGCDL